MTYDELPDYLTTREAAAYIRYTVKGLYALNTRGDGPPRISQGKNLLYPKAGLREWLEANRVQH